MQLIRAGELGLPEPGAEGFDFYEEDHLYTLNTKRIPATTQILNMLAPFPWPNIEAMERGSHVHLATALYDEGDLDLSTLDPEYLNYLEGWKKFLSEHPELRETRVVVEAPIYAKAPRLSGLEYGATLDRIYPDLGIAVDIKTGSPFSKRYSLQFQAYLHAARTWDLKLKHMLEVHLFGDGEYKLMGKHKYTAAKFNIFRSGITVWKYRNGKVA